jgi:O-antigen/teichoic acid export membrane protein
LDAVWVGGATALGQGIVLAAAPLLTRLYTPVELGTAALFFAMAQVASPFIDGRLSLLIPLPKLDVEAIQIGAAVVALSLAVCTVSQVGLAVIGADVAARWSGVPLASWLWVLPTALLISTLYQTLRLWGLRRQQFSTVAGGTICRSFANAAYPVLFVLLRPASIPPEAGLLFAPVVADAVGNAYFLFRFKRDRKLLRNISLLRVGQTLRSFARTIATFFCSQALNAVYGQIPIFAIGLFFGPAHAAMYGLAERFSSVPTQIVSRAFGDVYRQRAAQLWHSGESLYPLMRHGMIVLFLIGAVPYLTAATFGPSVFALVFGAPWRDAGMIASVLLVSRFVQFVQSGSEWTAAVVGANSYIFGWHAVRGTLYIVVTVAQGYLALNVLVVSAMFAIVDTLLWLVDLAVARSLAKRGRRP